ncbi:MAG: tetratricopeptide repeat protein [Bacilli bacterium]
MNSTDKVLQYIENQEWDSIYPEYAKFENQEITEVEVFTLIATMYIKANNLEVAKLLLLHAQEKYHNESRIHYLLGTVLYEQKEWIEAFDCFIQAVKNGYDFADVHFMIGNTLNALHSWRRAIPHFMFALEKTEQPDAELHYAYGYALLQCEMYELAFEQLRLALHIAPDHGDAHYNLAILYGKQNNAEQCVAHLNSALLVNPQHALAKATLSALQE